MTPRDLCCFFKRNAAFRTGDHDAAPSLRHAYLLAAAGAFEKAIGISLLKSELIDTEKTPDALRHMEITVVFSGSGCHIARQGPVIRVKQ